MMGFLLTALSAMKLNSPGGQQRFTTSPWAVLRRTVVIPASAAACVLMLAASEPAYADCQPNPPANGQTVTCTGPIPSTVPIISAATDVTVNINADAQISGGGVLISLGSGALITNNGSVQVNAPSSVGIIADSNSVLRNFGTIATTGSNALSAYTIGDNVLLSNEQGGQISISGDLSAGLLIGLGNNSALTNAGRITLNTFQGGGLFAQAGSGHVLTNTATGIIESNLDQAFGMNAQRGMDPGAGDDFLLLNQGTIITRGQASHGMLMNELTNSTAINSGSITTSGGSSETVNRAFGMFSFGGQGNTLLNAAAGVINASGLGSSGIELIESSGNLLRNDGTINVSGAGAHGVYVVAGAGNTLQNVGILNITGARGNGLRADDGGNSAVNSGTVLVQGTDAFGVFLQGTNNTLTNSGTIRATGNNADGVVSNTVAGSFVVTVNNSGSIISERRFAVRGVNGQESVINSGLIRSDAGTAIDLRGGNDSVILRTGSQIIGLADGGTGTDRVVLEGSGTASNDFQNFETLRMTGADWTWSGNGTFVGTQIESGVLRVGGTLTSPVTVQTGTTLQIGTGGTTGTVARDITDNGSVVFNRSNAVTFAGVVSGTGSLTQAGSGTTTLTGNNTYTGGTNINAGTLAAGADSALGGATGGITFNGGMLRLNNSFDLASTRAVALNAVGGTIDTQGFTTTLAQGATGAGRLTKQGAGTLALTGANTYTGGTTISAGTLQLGDGGSSGSIVGDVVDNGALLFNRSDVSTFSGVISGAGSASQIGSGTTVFTANSTYTGGTSITDGTLAVGDASHQAAAISGSGPVMIAAGATLGGYGSVTGTVTNRGTIAVADAVPAFAAGPAGDFTINGDLTNSGLLQIGGSGVGNRLVIAGDYVGQGGASAALNTYLGLDGSPSDRIVLDGGSASGMTGLAFTNVGGPGAQTVRDGILVVQALNGAQTHTFALSNFVSAGGFEYYLFSGGTSAGTSENWYLRNSIVAPSPLAPPSTPAPAPNPFAPLPQGPLPTPTGSFPLPVPTGDPSNPPVQPAPPTPGATPFIGAVIPLYSIEVPVAAAIPSAARQAALATLGTFHERRGGQGLLTPGEEFSAAWARTFGQSIERSQAGTVNPTIDGSLWGIQAGLDILRRESEGGHRDTAGVFLGYATLDADIRGFALGWNNLSVGDIDLDATSVGAYWTHIGPTGWYLDGVLAGSFFGGEAQSRRDIGIDTDGTGITASLEGGYPFALSPSWRIEPQAQLIWQHQSLDDAESRFATVSFDTGDAVTGRLGARLEGAFETSGGLMQPYLKANIWHDFSGTDTIRFGVNPFETVIDGTALELGGGLLASINENVSLYATADYTFDVDGANYRAFEGNIGLSAKW